MTDKKMEIMLYYNIVIKQEIINTCTIWKYNNNHTELKMRMIHWYS